LLSCISYFLSPARVKLEQISKLMDKINKKEGKNMISLGVTRNKNEQADAIALSSI